MLLRVLLEHCNAKKDDCPGPHVLGKGSAFAMSHNLQGMQLECALPLTSLRISKPLCAGVFQCQHAVTATAPEVSFLGGARALPSGGPRRRHSMSTADFSAISVWDRRAEVSRPAAAMTLSAVLTAAKATSDSPWLSACGHDSLRSACPTTECLQMHLPPAATFLGAVSAERVSRIPEREQTPVKVGFPC